METLESADLQVLNQLVSELTVDAQRLKLRVMHVIAVVLYYSYSLDDCVVI